MGHDMHRAQENAVYFGLVSKQRIQRFLQDTCERNVTLRSRCAEEVGGWTDSAFPDEGSDFRFRGNRLPVRNL